MPQFIDQMGNTITLEETPKRIVSLVPSQTELLFDLGLDEQIVGLTRFCVHPEGKKKEKKNVGGTKQVHFDRVEAIMPDLIIANKEENQQEQIEELQKHYPVWMSDIKTLDDSLEMIKNIGELTGTSEKAESIITQVKQDFSAFESKLERPLRTAYFIWKKPYMAAGGDTFINDMLKRCGFVNVFGEDTRYPEIDIEGLKKLNPELILLSSEPYPFKDRHIVELHTELPNAIIKLVDGELFSWYGSRLLHSATYFNELVGEVNEEFNRGGHRGNTQS